MKKIKMGSICLTAVDKKFHFDNYEILIKKGTYVLVCDDYNIKDGLVLVECEGFLRVFDYNINELNIVK